LAALADALRARHRKSALATDCYSPSAPEPPRDGRKQRANSRERSNPEPYGPLGEREGAPDNLNPAFAEGRGARGWYSGVLPRLGRRAVSAAPRAGAAGSGSVPKS